MPPCFLHLAATPQEIPIFAALQCILAYENCISLAFKLFAPGRKS